MTTRYTDYTEDTDYAEESDTATDTVRHKGWGALIFGLCLLPTPLMGLGAVLTALGVALLAISPKLQAIEDTADAHIADEQAQGRSGCGWMVWAVLWMVLVLVGVGVVLSAGLLMVRG